MLSTIHNAMCANTISNDSIFKFHIKKGIEYKDSCHCVEDLYACEQK